MKSKHMVFLMSLCCYNPMIHNHAHQKLFPNIVAHPCLLLLPIPLHHTQETPLLLCNQHVIKLHNSGLSPSNQHIIKLHFSKPFSAIVQHNVKLQDQPDYR
jgi:hypothetical protein